MPTRATFSSLRACYRVKSMRSLQEIAEGVGGRVVGDAGVMLLGVASLASAGSKDLVFVEDQKHLQAALHSSAGAIVAGEFAAETKCNRPLLITDHPKLAFARAATILQEQPDSNGPLIHSS